MSELKPNMERAISLIVAILSETVASSGMSKKEADELKQALRDLVVASRGNS